ncbi:MAG: TIGR02678 family protein [Bacillota bacterium]|nr:MAG: TIGR02678 family protein [Bacillota bacterium]
MATTGAAEQRQLALQDLIDRYVIRQADEPEAYRRVVLHEGYLRAWFHERPRWRILAGRGIYRLERLPARLLPHRGLPRLRSPLAYACLCWSLWFAETLGTAGRDWFVISELAERISSISEGRFTLAERSHRQALVQALQLLIDLGGLILRDGDVDRWVDGQEYLGEPPEVMYEFTETTPRLLANFSYGSLTVAAAADHGQRTAAPCGEESPPLARAWRALLLGPVFWKADDPEAFAVLEANEEAVCRDLEVALGWQLELTPTFARIWRTTTARGASGVLLDLYPEPGEEAEERNTRYIFHPILLLLGRCQEGVTEGRWPVEADGAVVISAGELHDLLSELRSQHRPSWGAVLGALPLEELVQQVLKEMRRMGLLRGPDRFGRCWLLPVAAGIRGQYVSREISNRRVPERERPRAEQSRLF